MPTFFVSSDAVTPPVVRISGPLLRHLRDSLRLHPGESLVVTDDQGRRYRTEITTVAEKAIEGRIVETATAPSRTNPKIVLAQAILKSEKMEWVIQKATELDVDSIVPVHTRHGVVKIKPERVEHQLARWQRIALEAAQQSERWTIPTIAEPTELSKVAVAYPSAGKFVMTERSTATAAATVALQSGPEQTILLVIGPEGGWDQDELHTMQEQGYRTVTLGSRILRAETAAIAGLSIIQSRLGELG
ncbi:MAG: 16S rRNA (uracil(1498)-N(3))-methyltransferase [Nitrospira sp. CR1.3]|nr:16S rRNA (uracil(1498)-N(3))-methyltransferase [Nitrospira sp. CR1.3]